MKELKERQKKYKLSSTIAIDTHEVYQIDIDVKDEFVPNEI